MTDSNEVYLKTLQFGFSFPQWQVTSWQLRTMKLIRFSVEWWVMAALEFVAEVIPQFQRCTALRFMFKKESEYNMFNLSTHVKVA